MPEDHFDNSAMINAIAHVIATADETVDILSAIRSMDYISSTEMPAVRVGLETTEIVIGTLVRLLRGQTEALAEVADRLEKFLDRLENDES